MEMQGEIAFGIPVFKAHIGTDQIVLDEIDRLTEQGGDRPPECWIGDLKTSYGPDTRFLSEEQLTPFGEMALHLINEAPEYGCKFDKLQIKYWYNSYDKGHFQEPHTHYPCTLSAVWFLRGDPSDLKFVSPTSFFPFTRNEQPFKFNNGDIVFFPSGLTHYVAPAKQPRTTVAFNFSVIYE